MSLESGKNVLLSREAPGLEKHRRHDSLKGKNAVRLSDGAHLTDVLRHKERSFF